MTRTSASALVIASALVVGCGAPSRGERIAIEPPLVIPKLPPDAGAVGMTASRRPGSQGHGWIVREGRGAMPESVDRAVAIEAIRVADHRAVVILHSRVDECSSAGGTHLFFTLSPPQRGTGHFGGHGIMLPPGFEKGDVWVAAIEPMGTTLSAEATPFCVPKLYFDSAVVGLVPVADREEGEALLEELRP